MNPSRRHALGLAAAMTGAAALAALARPRRRTGADAPGVVLDSAIPMAFAGWQVDKLSQTFVRPPDRQGKVYGIYDQLLERSYHDAQGQYVMLSVAFGSEQSSSLQLHRPEICYRAGGYRVSDTRPVALELAGQRVNARQLHAELPGRFEPITYWTVLGDRVAADSDSFRWRRLASVLQRELLDGMLVRVSSIDTDATRAYALQARFADDMARAIAPAERARIIGLPPQG